MNELEYLDELHRKATGAPWRTQSMGSCEADLIHRGTFAGINAGSGAPNVLGPDDQEEWESVVALIAAARNALPDFIAAVKLLEWLDERFRYRFENCDREFAQEKIVAALAPFMKEHG